MANTFKAGRAASIGTTATAVYTTPASTKSILIELDVANRTSSGVMVDVGIGTGSSITYYIVKGAVLPAGDTLQVVAGQKIILDGTTTAEKVFVLSSAAGSVDAIASVLEGVA